jgi:hypothetical protein
MASAIIEARQGSSSAEAEESETEEETGGEE